MDLKYVNPFIHTAIDIVQQISNLDFHLVNAFIKNESIVINDIGVSIELDGDIKGNIIFDFSRSVAEYLITKMLGSSVNDYKEELLLSGVQELSNFITGNTVPRLKENSYLCNISTPKLLTSKQIPVDPKELVYVVLEFSSQIGSFLISLTHSKNGLKDVLKLLLIGMEESILINYVSEYLSSGYLVFSTNHCNDADDILNNVNIDYILIDVDKIIKDISFYLNRIIQTSKNQNNKIILYMSEANTQQSVEMIYDLQNYYRVIGVVLKNEPYEKQSYNIKWMFEKAGIIHSDRRAYIRILPDLDDNFFVKIFNEKDSINFITKITDISLGGLSFNVKSSRIIPNFKKGDDLYLNVTLNNNSFSILSNILKIEDSKISVKYKDLSFEASNIISRVVLTKLKSNILQ